MKFEIEWTYGGKTIIHAQSKSAARMIFADTFDLAKHYEEDSEGVDIVGVTEDFSEADTSIDQKVVCIREGASLYTAREIANNLINEACAILDIERDEESPDEAEDDEALRETAREYENKLSAQGYTVVWNDGFVIYKDLTAKELELLQ